MKHLWLIQYSTDIEGYGLTEDFLVFAKTYSEAEEVARNYIELCFSPLDDDDDFLDDEEIPDYTIEHIEIFDDTKHGSIHHYQVI